MHDPPASGSDAVRRDGRPVPSATELETVRPFAEGRSTEQGAATMPIPTNTARTRIHHLRAELDVIDGQRVLRARDLGSS
jgi:hypothetical protein